MKDHCCKQNRRPYASPSPSKMNESNQQSKPLPHRREIDTDQLIQYIMCEYKMWCGLTTNSLTTNTTARLDTIPVLSWIN